MEKQLLTVVEELQKEGLMQPSLEGIEYKEIEEQFLCAVESLDVEDEHILSDLAVETYNKIVDRNQMAEEQSSVESYLTNTMENNMSDTPDVTKQILDIFNRWEEGGFANVEVPEEVTEKELKGLFLSTFNDMPFDQKMAGGMDEEIYNLSQSLIKKTKKSKSKKSDVDKKAEAEHLANMVEVANLVNNYLENPASLSDIESVPMTETQLLEMIFDMATEEIFCEIMKEEKVAALVRKLCVERKISTVVVKGKKRGRVVKKWDGEGEPFNKLTPTKEPSMTYAIWKKILDKDIKLSALNKWATKEFGAKKDGEPRDVSRVLVKMKKKVSDFYTISVGEVVSVSKVG